LPAWIVTVVDGVKCIYVVNDSDFVSTLDEGAGESLIPTASPPKLNGG
jgi:hypothetical protein